MLLPIRLLLIALQIAAGAAMGVVAACLLTLAVLIAALHGCVAMAREG